MVTVHDIEMVILEDFRKEASIVLDKYSHDIKWDQPANTWGGCFTPLPDNVSFNMIRSFLEKTQHSY
jgi:hypothetical protein